jgi:hypothetical protein
VRFGHDELPPFAWPDDACRERLHRRRFCRTYQNEGPVQLRAKKFPVESYRF